MAVTYRQLIQSLRDYKDQLASVMPYAEGAEAPCWGIAETWFEDGVLMLGQYDDEGDCCRGIADGVEACVPADKLDEPAVVKIGTIEDDGSGKQLYDAESEPARAKTVASSEVKPPTERVTDDPDEWVDDLDDDWSTDACKWVLKFE